MKKLVIYLLPLLIFSGCTKVIDLELNNDENQRLVVDAWFTTEPKEHEVKLTLTTSYFQNEEAPKVTGATVYVTDGVSTIPFNEVTPGIYRTASTAKANYNTNYTLHIEYEGETYEATSFADTVPKLDSITAAPGYDILGNYYGMDVNIWTQELPGTGDYYLWRIYLNGVLETNTLNEIDFESDEYLPDGVYFAEWPITYSESAASGDVLKLEQHHISKGTYDAIMAVMFETDWRGGIFDAPPANVPTNLSNGAVGLFVVSSVSSNTTVVP